MFQSRLKCGSCDYSTPQFINGYFPPKDSVDIVLQEETTWEIRVVSIDGIKASGGIENPTEEQLDALIASRCSDIASPSEHRINTWAAPEDFESLNCPKCKSKSLAIEFLSII